MIAIKEIINSPAIVEKYTIKEGKKVLGTITLNTQGEFCCFVRLNQSGGVGSKQPDYNSALKDIFYLHSLEYHIVPVRLKGVKYRS